MSDWTDIDSPVWEAKYSLEDAIGRIEPGRHDDPLTEEEAEVSLPLRGMGITLNAALKPSPDEIVPAIDKAINEMELMKDPSERITKAIKDAKKARASFAELTVDPEKFQQPKAGEDEEKPKEEKPKEEKPKKAKKKDEE